MTDVVGSVKFKDFSFKKYAIHKKQNIIKTFNQ